jgi:hypothetical protein
MHKRQFSETNPLIMSIGTQVSLSHLSQMIIDDHQVQQSCEPPAPFCRDKGWGRVDEGALCLSSSGYDPSASRNPTESSCHQDKHKAPTHPRLRPLSLQDAGVHFLSLAYPVDKIYQDEGRPLPGRRLTP